MGLCKPREAPTEHNCIGCDGYHGSVNLHIKCLESFLIIARDRLSRITRPIQQARAMPMSKGGAQEFREGFNEKKTE
jgi:hypothetical protein